MFGNQDYAKTAWRIVELAGTGPGAAGLPGYRVGAGRAGHHRVLLGQPGGHQGVEGKRRAPPGPEARPGLVRQLPGASVQGGAGVWILRVVEQPRSLEER